VVLNPALPFWKMLASVFLPAILGTSHCLVFVPLINTVLLLGAPMLPTQWVKMSTHLQLTRPSMFISDKPIFHSESMLYKDYGRKGSDAKNISGRDLKGLAVKTNLLAVNHHCKLTLTLILALS
jgi:hypothetical protein